MEMWINRGYAQGEMERKKKDKRTLLRASKCGYRRQLEHSGGLIIGVLWKTFRPVRSASAPFLA
jgi:hypothetical protein